MKPANRHAHGHLMSNKWIQEHQDNWLHLMKHDRSINGEGCRRVEAGSTKEALHDIAHGGIVIDDQNAAWSGSAAHDAVPD